MCLFTCASTRAVHLELTRGLTVQYFLLAFRRFASRRGLPATIQSDNAKTFQSSSKEIRKIARSPEVWRYLTDNRITWNFIVEKVPWWGGYWETRSKHQVTHQESYWAVYCELRRNVYLANRSRSSDQRQTAYLRLWRRRVSFLPVNSVRLNLWPTDHCTESQQSALRDHEHVQFFKQEIKASSIFAKSVYASVEERIPDQFTRTSFILTREYYKIS